MLVKDLMKANPITVFPETLLADVARIMLDRRLSGLPVIDRGGNLAGMITEGDLLRRPELGTVGKPSSWLMAFLMPARLARDYAHTHTRHVREAMTENVITVAADAELDAAVMLMVKKRIKRLPVVDGGKVVGIVSRADLLGVLTKELLKTDDTHPEPEAIKAQIRAALAREPWAPKSGIHVEVNKDSVTLSGSVFSEDERNALRIIAENTAGVKHVDDQLNYVDPASSLAFPIA